jgi:cysteine desulfurase
MREIYLDHNATTPLDPEVLEAMLPWLRDRHGNPSCGHRLGQEARRAIDEVRKQFVSFFGCGSDEVIFTSGGTESNNMAIKGAAWALEKKGRHIVVGASEHPSVLDAARFLGRFGFEVTEVAPDSTGQVSQAALRAALRKDTILVSIMNAQNVVGTINRVDELAENVLAGRGICFHVDAAHSAGKIPTAFPFFGCDLMTVAGHKMYGPKGVGALIVRRGLNLEPLLHGAGHEKGRRSGTENVAGIVGLGAALKLAQRTMAESGERMVALRDGLHLRLADGLTGVKLNGHPLDRLPNTLHVSFLGVTGKAIAERCPELLIATGPACHDRAADLPPALKSMGMDPLRASGALRLSLGKHTTWDEVERAADLIIAAVEALRAAAPSLPASANAPSDRPTCPRCEQHPLRLELTGIAPAVVCARHPVCRYEAWLAHPVGAA